MHYSGISYIREAHRFHFVVMCDETGIFDAFSFIKDWLAADMGYAFITLIYTVSDKNPHPLFEKELNILEKRLSYNLLVLISIVDTSTTYFEQELLEATINSNTLAVIKFSVFGNADFVTHVTGVLSFLEVKKFLVNSKVIFQPD